MVAKKGGLMSRVGVGLVCDPVLSGKEEGGSRRNRGQTWGQGMLLQRHKAKAWDASITILNRNTLQRSHSLFGVFIYFFNGQFQTYKL